MTKDNFTQIPNTFFKLIKELSESELKVLLIIIRQTDGWFDKETGTRKETDRITINQFASNTGLSRKAITYALDSLFKRKMITILDSYGNILDNRGKRRGKTVIFYSTQIKQAKNLRIQTSVNFSIFQRKFFQKPAKILRITKETNTKENITKERENEIRHIKEILDKEYSNWNP